ncbi:G-type lectin S-receptor-like serine threonine-kinase At4g27290 isoform X2, partial [Olea europaea subsp. europaea]
MHLSSSGDFSYHFDYTGYPHLLKNDSIVQLKSGPWNGLTYGGTPNLRKNLIFKYRVVLNKNEAYYTFELLNRSIISRFKLSVSGVGQRWMWVNRTKEWVVYITSPTDNCDNYRLCGAYGSWILQILLFVDVSLDFCLKIQ